MFIKLINFRRDIQNLRQENELFERQLSSSDGGAPSNNRESVSSDGGVVPNVSSCHIDGATNSSWSNKANVLDAKTSEESDQDGRF